MMCFNSINTNRGTGEYLKQAVEYTLGAMFKHHLLITSDRSRVAGVCTALQIPHIQTGFSGLLRVAPYCVPGGVKVVSNGVRNSGASAPTFSCGLSWSPPP
jgi:hypothetical protein